MTNDEAYLAGRRLGRTAYDCDRVIETVSTEPSDQLAAYVALENLVIRSASGVGDVLLNLMDKLWLELTDEDHIFLNGRTP